MILNNTGLRTTGIDIAERHSPSGLITLIKHWQLYYDMLNINNSAVK